MRSQKYFLCLVNLIKNCINNILLPKTRIRFPPISVNKTIDDNSDR